ncbi:RICIN domain-containing protein (plasmid) [Streptomyces sp. FXJ1.172]|uniref:RICIN domain-containing protein n=1 Tax=Streptomyces sp. FXJ1.172 TaxID=710705 RepID=UPI0023DD4095|nr:RICIN domain-containing protein [Streptomyces sp. FXJ1.172]WEP00641.1 RICIN domain-containing protein [Streptomyces sp. FXJ1.172]
MKVARKLGAGVAALASLALVSLSGGTAQASPGNWNLDTAYASNMCLDAAYVANDPVQNPWRNGDTVQMWHCNQQAQQGWIFHIQGYQPNGLPIFTITNQRSGLCLDMDISGGSVGGTGYDYYGHRVQLWTCNGWDNQLWYQGYGYAGDSVLQAGNGAKAGCGCDYLDAKNFGGWTPADDGDPVLVWDYIGYDAPQNWTWS